MADGKLKNRHGEPVTHITQLAKKTGKHAGVPAETALYIISAFIDVLVDEIVTEGGVTIPGLITFYTKNNTSRKPRNQSYGVVKKYDQDIAFRVSNGLQTMYRIHSTYCKPGERFVTKDTWRGLNYRYKRIFRDSAISCGINEITNVRKSTAPFMSKEKKDFIPLKRPVYVTYFEDLVREMNKAQIFDPTYLRDTVDIINGPQTRLLRATDFTDETVPYIVKNRLQKVDELIELREKGLIKGDYLDSNETFYNTAKEKLKEKNNEQK